MKTKIIAIIVTIIVLATAVGGCVYHRNDIAARLKLWQTEQAAPPADKPTEPAEDARRKIDISFSRAWNFKDTTVSPSELLIYAIEGKSFEAIPDATYILSGEIIENDVKKPFDNIEVNLTELYQGFEYLTTLDKDVALMLGDTGWAMVVIRNTSLYDLNSDYNAVNDVDLWVLIPLETFTGSVKLQNCKLIIKE